MDENLGVLYGVVKIDTSNNNNVTFLYESIPSLKEADLLTQSAMCNKESHEIIYISPGWNKSINKNEKYLGEYSKALELAKEYKAEEYIPF